MQPFQCDLQPEIPKHPITTHTQAHPKQLQATVTLRQKKTTNRPQPQPSHTRGTFHRRLQPLYTENTRFRAPASSPKHSPCNIMQPLQCGSQHQLANLHLSTHRTRPEQQMTRVMQPFQCDLQPEIPKHPITTHTKAHPKQLQATVTLRQKKKRQTDRSRNRRTHEVPFIVACSHFTRTNARFRAPASSPTHHLPSSPLPFLTTSHRHHLASSPLPFLTTSHRHHVPSSPPPFVHFPSSPLPFLTTPLHHHFPSSPPPFVHFPSSPLPFLTTPLPHHSPSSSLPFVTTSHRPHLPSSPLPFVTTSLRHHFSSSPPVIITTLHQDQFHRFLFLCYVLLCFVLLCNLPPFIISSLRILFVRNTEVLLPNFLWLFEVGSQLLSTGGCTIPPTSKLVMTSVLSRIFCQLSWSSKVSLMLWMHIIWSRHLALILFLPWFLLAEHTADSCMYRRAEALALWS